MNLQTESPKLCYRLHKLTFEEIVACIEKLKATIKNYAGNEYSSKAVAMIGKKRIRRKDKKALLYRNAIIFAVSDFYGTSVSRKALARAVCLVNHTSIMSAIEKISQGSHPFKEAMITEMKKIGGAMSGPAHRPADFQYVSARIDKKLWEAYVPNEYAQYAEKIFSLLADQGFEKTRVVSPLRKEELCNARKVFTYLFLKKFPETNQYFLAYLLGKENRSTISSIVKEHGTCMDQRFRNDPAVISFWELCNKIEVELAA